MLTHTYSLYSCRKQHQIYKDFLQAKINNNAAYFEKISYLINQFIREHQLHYPILYIYGKATPYLLMHTKQPKFPISKFSPLPYKTLDLENRYKYTRLYLPSQTIAVLPTLSTFILFDDIIVSGNTINMAIHQIYPKPHQHIIVLSYLTLR
ncbi:MAG: hypothetical protein GYA62_01205 [Bacteroidales bacterium]|nr:hypothetical protein [Bacteroidales bacterium]